MRYLAIDPGSSVSGFVIYDNVSNTIVSWGVIENSEILKIERSRFDVCLLETMAAIHIKSKYILKTIFWGGRFRERFGAICIERPKVLSTLLPKKTKEDPKTNDKRISVIVKECGAKNADKIDSHAIQAMALVLTYQKF